MTKRERAFDALYRTDAVIRMAVWAQAWTMLESLLDLRDRIIASIKEDDPPTETTTSDRRRWH